MMQELKKYQIKIFGESYSIVTDESEHSVNEAAALIDSLMKELSIKSSGVDEKKIAIFVALKVASKMLNLEIESKKVKEKENLLIQSIDKELSN